MLDAVSGQRTPYALYIHLAEYERSWGAPTPIPDQQLAAALRSAAHLLTQLIQNAQTDPRPYSARARRVSHLEQAQQELCLLAQQVAKHFPRVDAAALPEPTSVRVEGLYGPEDFLFASVHLVSESWFFVAHHLLAQVCAQLTSKNYLGAEASLTLVSEIIAAQVRFVSVLETMNHADYHYLRVRLRDASGAQSQRIQRLPRAAWTAWQLFLEGGLPEGLSLPTLLSRSAEFPQHDALLSAFQAVSRAFQSFLFGHYLMVCKILGSGSIGSLGAEVNSLVGHAARPLFPELDQAYFDYVQVTNLLYAPFSGEVVQAKEEAAQVADYTPYSGPGVASEVAVQAYFDRIEAKDSEGWLALFHPEGQLCDVAGSRPFQGRAKLGVFLKTFYKTFPQVRPQVHQVTHMGNTATATWTMEARSYKGEPVTFSGTETFVFDTEGLIRHAFADWEPSQLAWAILGDEGSSH